MGQAYSGNGLVINPEGLREALGNLEGGEVREEEILGNIRAEAGTRVRITGVRIGSDGYIWGERDPNGETIYRGSVPGGCGLYGELIAVEGVLG